MNTPAVARARSLSKFRNSPKKRPSALLDGQSIVQRLQQSSFGKFHEALQDLRSFLPMLHFKLPRVIVLGGKNAGKSSLLENVTKCPIFPRHSDFCTKMPVKLQLVQVATQAESSISIQWQGVSRQLDSKDDILAEVTKIMDTLDTVAADELTIQIRQVDVPTFELIDLPGLQLFPEEQEKLTMGLANKYLAEEDTLVLCVVDATLPSLTDSVALKMVLDSNKLHSTILALTKSDLVRTEPEIVKLFDRILHDTDAADNSLLQGLAGCIAVANRNHLDHVSLVEAEREEAAIFVSMLHDPADFYATPEMKQALQQNMTIGQVIVQLDKLFHNFIVQKWRPAALAFLAPLKQEVIDHIQQLGPAVEALSKDGVLETICDKVRYDQDICAAIRDTFIQVSRSKTLDGLVNLTPKEHGTLAWVESNIKIRARVDEAVETALQSDMYLKPVIRAFRQVFQKDSPLKLARFDTLLKELVFEILPERVAKAKADAQPTIYSMVQQALMELDSESPVLSQVFPKLDQSIKGCLMRNIIQQVKLRPLSLRKDFVLTEEAGVHSQRLHLQDKLEKLNTATAKISNIENAISVSPAEPLGAASSSQPSQMPPPDYEEPGVAEQEPISSTANAAHPAAAAAGGDAAVGDAAASSKQAPASSNGELQMQATPKAQDSFGEEFSAALLQSAHDSTLYPPSAPASSHGTPMPESYDAQAPRSTSSPRPSQDLAPAAEPAAASARNMAFSLMADGEVDLTPVQPASPHPSAAEIYADQDDQSRPASPVASDSEGYFDVNRDREDLPPSGQRPSGWRF